MQAFGFGFEHGGVAAMVGFDEIAMPAIVHLKAGIDAAATHTLIIDDTKRCAGDLLDMIFYVLPKRHDVALLIPLENDQTEMRHLH
jgi:hypothetical protein